MKKADAMKYGVALRDRMIGKGWKLRVWENLGWHYSVQCGTIAVHASHHSSDGKVLYSTLMSTNVADIGVGSSIFYEQRHFNDPNKAVRHQMKIARAVVKQLNDVMAYNEAALKPLPKKKGGSRG